MIKSKEQLVSILEAGEWETIKEFKSFLETKEIETALDNFRIGISYDSDQVEDTDAETEAFFASQIFLHEDGPNYVLLFDGKKAEAILNQIVSVEIYNTEIFDEFVSLALFDNAATCRKIVLDGFQVDFSVTATTANNEDYDFNVILQSEERTDGMKAFGKYGMFFASRFGHDGDQSHELAEFLRENHSEEFEVEYMDSLIASAEKIAKEYVEDISTFKKIIMLIKSENEYLIHNGDGEVTCIADESDNSKMLDILREFDLDDDTDVLEKVFGSDGVNAIRDAEQGIY